MVHTVRAIQNHLTKLDHGGVRLRVLEHLQAEFSSPLWKV